MKAMTLKNIAAACEGELILKNESDAEKEAVSVCLDSRKAESGGIFVATRGEKTDGHKYIGDCFNKGVLAVICEEKPNNDGNYILVKDSFIAIKKLAKFYKSQLNIKTVGIIGSVGKTSTKELVASVLKEKFRVCKTEGNFNNEVGVPLTIFSIGAEHEVAVIEMGISDFGEMDRLGDMVKPDVCVMTNIGPCHLEFLGDLDGVLKAKTEVFNHMTGNGIAVLNGDDNKLSTIKDVNGKRPYFYGRKDTNQVYSSNVCSGSFDGTEVIIHTPEGDFSTVIPIPGEHMVDNALAATAVGLFYGLSLDEIKAGIESAKTLAGRNNVIETLKWKVVDDCYNANPKSMTAAIKLLSQINDRKVAILGDMFELGVNENELHEQIGHILVDNGIDVVLLAGKLTKNIEKVLKDSKAPIEYYHKDTTDELIELIKQKDILKTKDTILVKASHGMNFQRIVNLLTE